MFSAADFPNLEAASDESSAVDVTLELNTSWAKPRNIFKSVKIHTLGLDLEVCRLCLEPVFKNNSQNKTSIDRVKFVFPDLNLDIYPEPVICGNCDWRVLQAAALRQLCVKSDKILQKYATKVPADIVLMLDGSLKKITVSPVDHDHIYAKSYIQSDFHEESTNGRKRHIPIKTETKPAAQASKFAAETNRRNHLPRKRHLPIKIEKKVSAAEDGAKVVQIVKHQNSTKKQILCRKKRYRCKNCYQTFVLALDLKMHLTSCQKPVIVQCHLCGKKMRKSSFKNHLDTHDPTKFVVCSVCKKPIRKYGIKKHLRTHEPASTQCHQCGLIVKSINLLRVHLESEHVNLKNLVCEDCGQQFFQKWKLLKHMANVHGIIDAGKSNQKEAVEINEATSTVVDGEFTIEEQDICSFET